MNSKYSESYNPKQSRYDNRLSRKKKKSQKFKQLQREAFSK